ncbi:hypothetical protein [Stappia sp. ES.058]|uniref:hypothetical protein n=2 Tax=Stappia TaxID=152161 RepID=UPI00048B680C|nr:hypothetical protein [Stappia sp. ES.058]
MKKFFLLFIVLAFAAFQVNAWRNKVEGTKRFITGLPLSIEVEGYVMRNARVGLLNSLISDACGITAIRITDATAQKIKEQGLPFFENAKISRSDKARHRSPVFYEDWQKMPPRSRLSIGESMIMWASSCAGRSGIPFEQIVDGLTGGSGYVSGGRGYSEMYVFPDQKLFVHAFVD